MGAMTYDFNKNKFKFKCTNFIKIKIFRALFYLGKGIALKSKHAKQTKASREAHLKYSAREGECVRDKQANATFMLRNFCSYCFINWKECVRE